MYQKNHIMYIKQKITYILCLHYYTLYNFIKLDKTNLYILFRTGLFRKTKIFSNEFFSDFLGHYFILYVSYLITVIQIQKYYLDISNKNNDVNGPNVIHCRPIPYFNLSIFHFKSISSLFLIANYPEIIDASRKN